MFWLYSLSLGGPIWPIGVGGPRVCTVRTHSSYATALLVRALHRNRRAAGSIHFTQLLLIR